MDPQLDLKVKARRLMMMSWITERRFCAIAASALTSSATDFEYFPQNVAWMFPVSLNLKGPLRGIHERQIAVIVAMTSEALYLQPALSLPEGTAARRFSSLRPVNCKSSIFYLCWPPTLALLAQLSCLLVNVRPK